MTEASERRRPNSNLCLLRDAEGLSAWDVFEWFPVSAAIEGPDVQNKEVSRMRREFTDQNGLEDPLKVNGGAIN